MKRQYWLLKSEPTTFSIDDLLNAPSQRTGWDGVRNYQARNMMRDEMNVGDFAFFYHSNTQTPAIVGLVEIVKAAYPDPTQFDIHSDYYDPKATSEHPRWFQVDVQFKEKFNTIISLERMKTIPALSEMPLVRKGNRLSVMPVTTFEFTTIMDLV